MKTAGLHLYAIAEAVHRCGFEGDFPRLQHWSCAAGHAEAVDLLLVNPASYLQTHTPPAFLPRYAHAHLHAQTDRPRRRPCALEMCPAGHGSLDPVANSAMRAPSTGAQRSVVRSPRIVWSATEACT